MNNDVVFTNGNRMMLISLKSDRQKVQITYVPKLRKIRSVMNVNAKGE